MSREFLRVYQEFDIEEVKKHLLIWGDLTADCASCRELGLDGYTIKACSKCGTTFKYITSRRTEEHASERFQIVRRASDKRPELIFIDYGDYMKTIGQKKARDFFA